MIGISFRFCRGLIAGSVLLLAGLVSNTALAQMYPADSDIGVPGEEMFQACGFCHGNVGQGRPRLDAPPIAGLQAWYVERQLNNFDTGIRGYHAEDLPGAQMDVISSMLRNEETIRNVAAFVESLEPGGPPMMRGRGENAQPEPLERPFVWESEYASFESPEPGDVDRGAKIYSGTCLACHGAKALGLENLGAPNLTVLPVWYMARQMEYFRDDIRGADRRDVFGPQMAVFAKFLENDQAIADVLAYIDTL